MTHRGPREKTHPVRLYLDRVASQDLGEYPNWDLAVSYHPAIQSQLRYSISLFSQIVLEDHEWSLYESQRFFF